MALEKQSMSASDRFWVRLAPLSPLVEERLRAEQYFQIFNQSLTINVVNVINASLMLVVFWGAAPMPILGGWYSLLILASLANLFSYFRKRKLSKPSRVSNQATQRAVRGGATLGLLWGLAAFIFFSPQALAHNIFIAFMIGGMVAGAVTTMYPLPRSCLAFSICALTPLVVRFVAVGDYMYVVMGVLLAVFMAALIVAARNAFKRFADLVVTRCELDETKETLLDAIESASDAFALFARDGELVVKNSKYDKWFRPEDQRPPALSANQIEQKLPDGRWVLSSNHETGAGGVVSVHRDISELKDRERDLRLARDAADSANVAKSEFLAMMSHELRTPLNAIIGFSEILKSDAGQTFSDGHRRDYANEIFHSGQHLLDLINDILDLARIASGQYDLNEETFALEPTIHRAVDMFQEQAARASIKIEISFGETLPHLYADQRAIKQILVCLVSNAVKFGRAGASIVVNARTSATGLVLSVQDDGPGIAAEEQDRVFEPFRQVHSDLVRPEDGSGLGLPLARHLAELHGGELRLFSAIGEGSRFEIHLGKNRLRDRAPQPKSAANV